LKEHRQGSWTPTRAFALAALAARSSSDILLVLKELSLKSNREISSQKVRPCFVQFVRAKVRRRWRRQGLRHHAGLFAKLPKKN
jgi:hypothetical protein